VFVVQVLREFAVKDLEFESSLYTRVSRTSTTRIRRRRFFFLQVKKAICRQNKGDKKIKKKTKEGEKVAPAKARFRVSSTEKFLFWFTSIWALRDPSRLNIGSYETLTTRKPCAKEVLATDYLTQRKQYLKRATLRTQ
jgi:hypothetical protein